jgi:hypothetical protein
VPRFEKTVLERHDPQNEGVKDSDQVSKHNEAGREQAQNEDALENDIGDIRGEGVARALVRTGWANEVCLQLHLVLIVRARPAKRQEVPCVDIGSSARLNISVTQLVPENEYNVGSSSLQSAALARTSR